MARITLYTDSEGKRMLNHDLECYAWADKDRFTDMEMFMFTIDTSDVADYGDGTYCIRRVSSIQWNVRPSLGSAPKTYSQSLDDMLDKIKKDGVE